MKETKKSSQLLYSNGKNVKKNPISLILCA